jgi:two-component system, NtrC family, sensor kinase
MPIPLDDFGLHQMLTCSNGMRAAMRDARTLEAAARKASRFLYEELSGEGNKRACALVRVYKTHPFSDLEPALQQVARRMLPGAKPFPKLRCLTLLATTGDEPAWNDRRESVGHQAIPLPEPAVVERAPMVAALIRAFGIDVAAAVAPDPDLTRDLVGKTYGVFHVKDAKGSPSIPAQDFVDAHGIRSVVGFGGSLSTGDLFATLLFTRIDVDAAAADRFRTIALDMKSRFFSFQPSETFDASA